MDNIWKLIFAGASIYLVIIAFVYYSQSSLIYYPNMPGRNLIATPEQIGLKYQNVQLVTADGVNLHGWFIPSNHAIGTVVFFHGNAGNISHRLESIDVFNGLNLNVFIIDYRGYGKSEGKVTEKGTYRDAEAAWIYLTETRSISTNKIIIFGRSLGASIATWLASKKTPAALIIESGFTSIPSIAKRIYPYLPVRWLTHFKYDTKSYVKNLSSPVLVVHSKNDEIIPFDEGLELFNAAPKNKQFLEMRGGHNDGFLITGSAYIEGLRTFIQSNLQ